MSSALATLELVSWWLIWLAGILTAVVTVALVVERTTMMLRSMLRWRVEQRYEPLVRRALAGDEVAHRALVDSPSRHRLTIAALLVLPLIDDRNPGRIARTRTLVGTLQLVTVADRYLRSRFWWRRAVALHVFGLIQERRRAAAIVGALDDPHEDVRSAALDALTDLQDPSTLPAIVVRLHDASLQRERRLAALTAFGSGAEPLLLELAGLDSEHRLHIAQALAICGTAQSRPTLSGWSEDPRSEVRTAALEALGQVGLDDIALQCTLLALASDDSHVRAAAARTLRGCRETADVAAQLAPLLDDTWEVAVRAAESLQAMGPAGLFELQRRAQHPGVAGELARQKLWQPAAT
jgi:HEAT repeat protein